MTNNAGVKALKDLNLKMRQRGTSFVFDGEKADFELWMYIIFEMHPETSFVLNGVKVNVYSYNHTDDIVLVKELTHSRFALFDLIEDYYKELCEILTDAKRGF